MATYIDNQPIFFGTEGECSSDELTFPQIVDLGDVQQFQFNAAPCEDAEQLMPDPTFESEENYNLGEGWGISYNTICLSGSVDAGSSFSTSESGYCYSPFTGDGYYEVTVEVQNISIGGSLGVYIGTLLIGTITSTGSFTFYGFANMPISGCYPLVVTSLADDTTTCITEIDAYEILTNFIVAFYTSDGTFVTSAAYIDYGTDLAVFSGNTVTFTINWNALGIDQEDCYYMCLLDPCINSNGQNYAAVILNEGMFSDGMGGTTNWSYSPFCWTSQPTYVIGTSSGLSNDLGQVNVFQSLLNSYTVQVTITAGTGIALDVYFGTQYVQTLTSIGTHTVTGTPLTNGNIGFDLTAGVGVVIDMVHSVVPDGSPSNPFDCNFKSNTFRIGDFEDSCSLVITACNNSSGLGFNFDGSSFAPSLRIPAKLKQATYPAERLTFEDSVGEKKVNYFTGRKAKYLATDLQPEYIHDFIQLLRGFDNFYIDGVRYFVEDDEYSVEWGDQDGIGKVRFLVSTRKQNVKNTNCSDTESNCNFDK